MIDIIERQREIVGRPYGRLKTRVYLHRVGTNPASDPAICGYGVNPGIDPSETRASFRSVDPRSKYAGQREPRGAYLARTGSLEGGSETILATISASGACLQMSHSCPGGYAPTTRKSRLASSRQ